MMPGRGEGCDLEAAGRQSPRIPHLNNCRQCASGDARVSSLGFWMKVEPSWGSGC